ncbi:MAG: hypothetical protein Athens101428_739 [Candidatus Berkelbacteria bacterium Athens1014_28]|uniref:Uncharacterized protein n=1 Tax=Candidatus Berkelbacteria bacterium Athens1014_28 TaxID=2017145 RepID=A0A554LJR8_9BACT|nr:MAG: hypothetical protein Athens101428_739 [Candidatus Berkelbacteria bacterium Athens1014_28]
MTQNTYKKGTLNLFIYPDKNHFTGVCLELDIIVEGKSAYEVRQELFDGVSSYVETIIKNKLPESLLNRPAPKEYWDRFFALLAEEIKAHKNRNLTPTKNSSFEFMKIPIGDTRRVLQPC